MSGHRLRIGGRIDRDRPLGFRFEGRSLVGFAGDTLASALLASGVSIVGRSFKYHRPRGLFAAGPEEPNAIIQLGPRPDLKATQVLLEEGLEAGPVNCWPGSRFDAGAAIGLAKRFLPAGFYYKTFKWPDWNWWEPLIRRAAGLGRVDPTASAPEGQRRSLHCDVLVIGAGPAGMAAALAAGAAGLRVVLAEQDRLLGGSLLVDRGEIDGMPSDQWLERAEATLAARRETTILRRTTVLGCYDHGLVAAVERERIVWKIRAARVVVATGAIERPIAFQDDDRPGVMLAGAVRAYLNRWAAAAGRRLVLFTNNDEAYRTAIDWRQAGLDVAAIVDARRSTEGALPDAARAAGIRIVTNATLDRALGRGRVRGVVLRDGTGKTSHIDCDTVAVSGGRDPAVALFVQAGGKLAWQDQIAAFVPGDGGYTTPVGAAAGLFGLGSALAHGHAAGLAGQTVPDILPPAAEDAAQGTILALWHAGGDPARSWVDRASDVTVADVGMAAGEGYVSVEHYKRYTTSGMSPDQGKSSGVLALSLLGRATGRVQADVGTTRFRPPWDPVPISALVGADRGQRLRPVLHLAAHDRHAALGAAFEEYGGWMRPACYPAPGEGREAAIRREAAAVRAGVGLFDASPLGKIDVRGPDAGRFLDRMYIHRLSTLKPGRLRYTLAANEAGIVQDDGVVARLGPDRFLVGTTSGGAVRMAEAFEEWLQCEWVDLEVFVTPVTQQWGVVNLAGPQARALLAAAGTDIELETAAFPHMTFREGLVAGISARVSRVSFTGELSYEVAVPAGRTAELWDALTAAAGPAGIAPPVPFGIEALMVLRIEKGYLHVGADTDGTTYPADCGFGDVVAKRTDDFVGRRSMRRPDAVRDGRLQLVGLLPEAADAKLAAGAHIVAADEGSDGHVSSACWSPALGRSVGLAMIRNGRARLDETVTVDDLGRRLRARIVRPVFVDPDGTRLK
ncbi:sarcosine oxidase subunit alpha [Stella humosa]|uniref:Sarcosine oxidase subunit alpha n=1 Tax=Stella humosa TaxID=94 RepID=A0A3N1KYE3_9PROT|nr:2Fe-2S iron-sulfur cluster-binding protein [Stella humosa]ROP84177.1 sarcosine oxidase subunit alpha [Stella humosa]BBK33689.1 sarcosine oxidase subunit alpha [Stella humosa]